MTKVAKLDLKLMINCIAMGGIVGVFTWAFLSFVNLGINFIWNTMGNFFDIKYWTFVVAIFGGLIVGITQKYLGEYPKYMDEVIGEFRSTKRVDYKNLKNSIINAITVLLFGASVGPEAALTGIIGGLSTCVGDKIKDRFKKKNIISENSEVIIEYSMYASISILFSAPLFGLYKLTGEEENDTKVIKKIKAIVYTITTLAGFLAFFILSKINHLESFIVKYGQCNITLKEILWAIPLFLIAMILAYTYKIYGVIIGKILMPLKDKKILKGIIGGISIGLIGTLLPYTLFSGEHELKKLVVEWGSMSAYMLILIAFVKLLLTEICLSTGHRGGHIFPLIFSSSCLAYAVSILLGIDSVFCLAIIVTAVTSKVIKNIYITIFLLILFFPMDALIVIIAAAIMGNMFNKIEVRKRKK